MKMRSPLLAAACLALLTIPGTPAAAMVWKPAAADHHSDGHGMRPTSQSYRLVVGHGAAVRLLLPDLSTRRLAPDATGRTTIPSTRMEYYHALIAERDAGARHEAAIRYLHLFGKPSGRSPSELLAARHTPLDIVPRPLPREHWRYLSGNTFTFIVRFHGQPLAGQTVTLQTANGTIRQFDSDHQGRIDIRLPDDFPDVQPGRASNRPAEFMLSAEHRDDGRLYATTLSAPYSPSPTHWQSPAFGLSALAGGLLLGGFLSLRLGQKTAGKKRGGR